MSGLQWIANQYDTGYTFTLCEGITPRELLVRIGARAQHILELTDLDVTELQSRSEDGHLSDLDFLDWEDEERVAQLQGAGFLSRPDVVVRAGSTQGWAYAVEHFSSRATNYLDALSHGTRAYAVFRSGAGMQQVGYACQGRVLAYYEPRKSMQQRATTETEVPGFLYTNEESPDIAFLRFLERRLKIHIAWEDTLIPLPAAAFTHAHL
ncbi:DUF6461 domain-containing protein [Streptomyces sp. NPDC060235]|uniref:DUF6461 domain-containing protein n=1 Tax=unclassified Streptomyces TaxID=2593676 RepID=UPI0036532102